MNGQLEGWMNEWVQEEGCKERALGREPLSLFPAPALEAGLGNLPPRPQGGRLPNLLPPTPQPF